MSSHDTDELSGEVARCTRATEVSREKKVAGDNVVAGMSKYTHPPPVSGFALNALNDLSCQKRYSFLSLAHDLKLPDACMLVHLF